MKRQDPVGITIELKGPNIVFTPDASMLLQSGTLVFFSNQTNLQLNITLAAPPAPAAAFVSVDAGSQSIGVTMPAGNPQVLNCSNHAAVPCTLAVSDQLTIIRRATEVIFDPLLIQPAAPTWVIWENTDGEPHQPVPDVGTTWSAYPSVVQPYSYSDLINFPNPGSYPYHCNLHPTEHGIIALATMIQISAGQFNFGSPLTVPPGTQITWMNTDSVAHEPVPVSGPAWPALPGVIVPNAFSTPIQFNTIGSYDYQCKLHPTETGQIIVSTS